MRYCRLLLIAGIIASTFCLGFLAYHFPWPAFIVGAVIVARQIKRHGRNLFAHGTARWASVADLERAGMLGGETGLIIGQVSTQRPSFIRALRDLFDSRVPAAEACERFVFSMRKLQPFHKAATVRLNRAVHTAVFAPTGVGKGVSLVVPFLLECPDSCVVIDPKGENARLTADHRRKLGYRVVLLDPFKVATQTPDTFNPLDMIDENSPLALDDCRAIAKEFVISTGTEPDPHWNLSSENLISALIAATLFMPKENRSLQTVRSLLTDTARREFVLGKMRESKEWGGMLARIASMVMNWKDKELSGIISTANRHLSFLDSLMIADSTSTSSFDPAALKTGKVTVYLILPPKHLKSQSALLRMWIGAMLRACINGLDEQNKVHFILDEAASLERMEVLEDAVDKYRAYGLRLQFYYQDIHQLKQCWRDGLDQSLLSNTTQVYFGVQDYDTAEHVSNLLGEETIIVDNGGTNTGGSTSANTQDAGENVGRSWGANRGWAQQARKLLKPEEVIGLPQCTAITVTPGMPPIATTLTRYYESGNEITRWRLLRVRAEVWLAAVLMLGLSSFMGVWMTGILSHPVWRSR